MKFYKGLSIAFAISIPIWVALLYTVFYMPVAFWFGAMAVMFVSLLIIARR